MSSNETADTTVRPVDLAERERRPLFPVERRRLAIEILADEASPVDLEELAAEIAVRENGSGTADATAVERVAIEFHHDHLPEMADLDVLDYDPTSHRINPAEMIVESKRVESEEVEELCRRVETVEQQLDGLEAEDGTDSINFDPELAHKIVHACIHSERITEDEELQLLKDLMA